MIQYHFSDYRLITPGLWVWRNFTPREIACRGDGSILIVPRALDMLQALRDRLGRALVINSGYRSPEHNAKVGGSPRSKHLEGIAFDIALRPGLDMQTLINHARAVGFKGIGRYDTFVHVDARKQEASWDFRKQGAKKHD